MSLAVLADKAGAVNGYDHLLLLQRGVVQKLIEAALEEGQSQIDEAGDAFADEDNLDYQFIDIQEAREYGVMPITR